MVRYKHLTQTWIEIREEDTEDLLEEMKFYMLKMMKGTKATLYYANRRSKIS